MAPSTLAVKRSRYQSARSQLNRVGVQVLRGIRRSSATESQTPFELDMSLSVSCDLVDGKREDGANRDGLADLWVNAPKHPVVRDGGGAFFSEDADVVIPTSDARDHVNEELNAVLALGVVFCHGMLDTESLFNASRVCSQWVCLVNESRTGHVVRLDVNRLFPRCARLVGSRLHDAFVSSSRAGTNVLDFTPLSISVNVALKSSAIVGNGLDFTQLRRLDLSHSTELTDLKPVKSLLASNQLTHLNVSFCPRLTSLNGIQRAQVLRTLDASHCAQLKNISALAEILSTVQRIRLSACPKLSDGQLARALAPENKQAIALSHLVLSDCPKLSTDYTVSMLFNICPSLDYVNISGCDKLVRKVREDPILGSFPVEPLVPVPVR